MTLPNAWQPRPRLNLHTFPLSAQLSQGQRTLILIRSLQHQPYQEKPR